VVKVSAQGRIAIDMDEVVADSLGRFLDIYAREFGTRIAREDLRGRHLFDAVPAEHREAVRGYPRREEFFHDLDVIPGSVEAVRALSARYEIFFATAAMEYPNSFLPKYDWLHRHFPFVPWRNFVYCGDKSVIRADVLIDDHRRNFRGFEGRGLLFSAPHNLLEEGVERVRDWAHVCELLLR
jgi:5'-nucleotidase